ncbi:MAG TPA: hypothetical protein ENG95_00565 [Nitrospirae bacterium]|nr:hypothetical protein [Nitrospirota bacterium]HDK82490.1 hypothetical protein [Nitrospirota bacterium]HDO25118.1 hypothetical protein [Nitrospirota bacterium]
MRKPQFVNDYVYHLFNRGVEKRKIFMDDDDYFRFIQNLYEFNDENPVTNFGYFFNPRSMNVEFRATRALKKERPPRKRLVEILVFTLMPNHFHLLIRQKARDGIVRFMQKLGTGYTMYFNQKYKRVGGLFQGRFKGVLIISQEHFEYLPHYIHLNPLELIYRGSTSIDWRGKIKSLEDYRWSSFPDYIGKANFPSVTHREYLLDMFAGEKQYKKDAVSILKERFFSQNKELMQDVVID